MSEDSTHPLAPAYANLRDDLDVAAEQGLAAGS